MHRTLSTILLCAGLGGCSPAEPPVPASGAVAAPERPAEPLVSPTPVTPKVWSLRLTSQFLGTAAGPVEVVTVDSSGPVSVAVDGAVVGQSVLAAAELEPLARLLGAPGLAAAKSTSQDMGPTTQLVVTGDLRLDLAGGGPEVNPVLREVDRLRDLVAPPENFKVVAVDGDTEVLVSSNGYVEIKRGAAAAISHNLPTQALGKVRALLGVTALRTASSWTAPTGAATLKITGDMNVSGVVDLTIKGAAPALLAEAMRLGAAVEAKTRRPAEIEAVFTQQMHGAGPGPLRTLTVRSSDRHLVITDEAPDAERFERGLTDEEWNSLLDMLIDPGFRLAEGTPPPGEGMVYRVKITGDSPMDATFRGEPPQALVQVMNRLDYFARHQ